MLLLPPHIKGAQRKYRREGPLRRSRLMRHRKGWTDAGIRQRRVGRNCPMDYETFEDVIENHAVHRECLQQAPIAFGAQLYEPATVRRPARLALDGVCRYRRVSPLLLVPEVLPERSTRVLIRVDFHDKSLRGGYKPVMRSA